VLPAVLSAAYLSFLAAYWDNPEMADEKQSCTNSG
jgi:hypothetical protein